MSVNVAGAVETAPVSELHAFRSHDPEDFGVPTGREEEWRFTPLRRLRGLHTDALLGSGGVTVEVAPAPEVTVDLSKRAAPIPREHGIPSATFIPADRISARAAQAVTHATVIRVPKEVVASGPTVVTITGVSAEAATAGHITIEAEPFARAVVVLDYRGSATYAENVEIIAGDGADLSVISIAGWADDSVHVTQHYARVGRDAHLTHVAVTLGGSLVRLAPSVTYTGPGGDAELYGLYFADAGQHLEHRLFIDHDTPNCRSRVRYKGALSGEDAHTVWIGDVLIRVAATGTDTYEYNRNLILTDGARADSVPNLEILTGEVVGAGHASASGRLDDEHLFYLMARGIPLHEARRLVIRGFFGELIAKIPELPLGAHELRERISEAFEAELS
jgi:Fe-S cluster assembly protein SufD